MTDLKNGDLIYFLDDLTFTNNIRSIEFKNKILKIKQINKYSIIINLDGAEFSFTDLLLSFNYIKL